MGEHELSGGPALQLRRFIVVFHGALQRLMFSGRKENVRRRVTGGDNG